VPERLLLVGMTGAGKTTVAALLAARLGWDVLDTDQEVETATGSSVGELFATRGEAGFRVAETEVLTGVPRTSKDTVVSVAGGAVLDPANRTLLSSSGTVCFLRADLSTLVARVGDGAGRPLLEADPEAALARLLEEREPLYTQIADIIVDVDGLSADQVVDQVLASLGRAASGERLQPAGEVR
jgi:shikimate kinase